jgi:nitrilase
MKQELRVAIAQISPIWLQRRATTEKMISYMHRAVKEGCDLIVFGEALLPGYPFWLDFTDSARFNNTLQKELHAHYCREAVCIEAGHLDAFCHLAQQYTIAMMIGIVERPEDRGGHSLYCSLVYIDKQGKIRNVHRKLMPTYEERLCWSVGDGHGLNVYPLEAFNIGGLNCWENWMPLPRAALYAQGEDLHIALWPGNHRNTDILTRFLAREGRSYTISVSGLMHKQDIPRETPHYDLIIEKAPDIMADGGSCAASPDGSWLLEPVVGAERLSIVPIDYQRIYEERQNFDPSGHYSRPDVTQLLLNKERQGIIKAMKNRD